MIWWWFSWFICSLSNIIIMATHDENAVTSRLRYGQTASRLLPYYECRLISPYGLIVLRTPHSRLWMSMRGDMRSVGIRGAGWWCSSLTAMRLFAHFSLGHRTEDFADDVSNVPPQVDMSPPPRGRAGAFRKARTMPVFNFATFIYYHDFTKYRIPVTSL